jgi:serine/threonine-protein kinase
VVIYLPRIGARVGDYLLTQKMGEGGSGHVYKAERGARLFAIKFLSGPQLTGGARSS